MGITFMSLAFWSVNAFLCVHAGSAAVYAYVGEHLQLNCTSPKQRPVDLKFKKVPFQGQKYEDVDSHLFKIIDDSTAALRWDNITSNDTGYYICLRTNESTKPIPSFDVRVQYKPHNISNLNCVLMNWNEYLFCSWQHPVPYNLDLEDVEISLKYYPSGANEGKYECPKLTPFNCTWPRHEGNSDFSIWITVKNKVRLDTAIAEFNIISREIAKPSQVKKIFVTELRAKNCFNISWKNYYPTLSSEIIEKFELHHQGPEDKEMKQIAVIPGDKRFKKICYMKPYTAHNFSVICQATSSKLWSDPILLNYTTPQKAPSSGPESVNGSYTSGPCVNNTRNVTVYWKQVESQARNGIITNYSLTHTYNSTAYTLTHKYNSTVYTLAHTYNSTAGPNVHQSSLIMSCNSVEYVEISASTIAGLSTKQTVLTIAPYYFEVPSIVENSLAVDGSSLRISWDSASEAGVSFTYAVFWIKDMPNSSNQPEISWAVIEGNQSYYDIALKDRDLKIGISVSKNSTGLWSPIYWTSCVFNDKSSLSELKFEVDVVTIRGSAIVSWELPCSKTYRYKHSYFVIFYYLETEGIENSLRVEIPALSEPLYIVNNLLAGGTYLFGMSIKDGNEIEEPVSHWKKAFTLSISEDEATKTITVAVICVALVLASVGIIFLIRCFVKSRKRVNRWIRSDEDSGVYLLPEQSSGDDNSSTKSALYDPSSLLHNGTNCNSKQLGTTLLKSIPGLKDAVKAVERNLIPIEHKPLLPPVQSCSEKIHAGGITAYTVIKSANLELRQQFDSQRVSLDGNMDIGHNTHHSACKDYVKIGENKSTGSDPSGKVFHVNAVENPGKQLVLPVSMKKTYISVNTGIHDVEKVSSSKNVTQCKDYVTMAEKGDLTNQLLVSIDQHMKNCGNETINKNSLTIHLSAHTHLDVKSLDYVTVNENGLTNQPSAPKDNSHVKNFDYVTVNEHGLTNQQSAPTDNSHVKNLDYVTLNENGLTNQSSARKENSHLKTLDYVTVNENGLTNQPLVPKDNSCVKNLDYVTVNKNGLTNQPSAPQKSSHVKNLDYVTVNENGLTNQPSAPKDHSCVKNLDYVTVNENGLTNQPSAPKDDFHVKNLDYVTVHENGLTNQPSAPKENSHVKTLDYVTVNENGLTNQPLVPKDNSCVKNLDYVTVNDNGLTNQPSVPKDNSCVKNRDYVTVNKNGLTNQPSAPKTNSHVKNLDYATVNENGLTNQPSAPKDHSCVKNRDYVTVNKNGLTNQPSAPKTNSRVKNLDYATVNENGLTKQPSVPKENSHVKTLDYVTVNENGFTNQPSAPKYHSCVKNLDYVTVNENGLTKQQSVPTDNFYVKNLDYVTVNENGLTKQPSAPKENSHVKTLDYVTVNENGFTNQPSAPKDHSCVKNLDYVTVNENGLTKQQSVPTDNFYVKNLDYVTVNENGLTKQPSAPKENSHVKTLDYVTVNENGLTNHPLAPKDT